MSLDGMERSVVLMTLGLCRIPRAQQRIHEMDYKSAQKRLCKECLQYYPPLAYTDFFPHSLQPATRVRDALNE